MSEKPEKDSQTEAPSEKKINDTIEKGKLPVSRELINSFGFLGIFVTTLVFAPYLIGDLVVSLRTVFANGREWSLERPEDAANTLYFVSSQAIGSVAPVVMTLMIFGLLSSIVQNRPRVVADRIAPKFENISPSNGLQRIFGKKGFQEFCKSLFKFSAAGLTGLTVLWFQRDNLLAQLDVDLIHVFENTYYLFLQITIGLFASAALLAAVDFVWVRQEWYDGLKMTHQEVREERKQTEGDPTVKMRSRSVARDRARRRMISRVGEATVVIANPTHFSIALRYIPDQDAAPIVIGKGQDLIALKIREIAENDNIPIVEDKPLARSLYKAVEIDREIPAVFFIPVAKIIRALMEKEVVKS